ncbi:hypothetical protein CTRI78_v006368 [Colletotrichum trifolii]|uniref:Uncharacterized protein n=1 Tax=Colletotrichum trifolii TaxID=5466 RepID=A0A4R8RCL9_COLTR|nr:hypothetical protein CTRI78_v006368 [Colletotrichum trifolii]
MQIETDHEAWMGGQGNDCDTSSDIVGERLYDDGAIPRWRPCPRRRRFPPGDVLWQMGSSRPRMCLAFDPPDPVFRCSRDFI